ncbi:hypothetical protein K431DRAFT_67698 [Polychaeton citri CBS 116435]|uniref:Uncharacterized protein n=1 Tax=Polychaeton citri CBS 116435 TaxID=1314669 RepID=A0A9P4UR54_9PEZI|nr:hypothetical protein K431DRAFT_67698 [Polychaeton citri CBS 116435]
MVIISSSLNFSWQMGQSSTRLDVAVHLIAIVPGLESTVVVDIIIVVISAVRRIMELKPLS